MSKTLTGTISLDHQDLVILFKEKPEMEDFVQVPLHGHGVVIGINNQYKGTDETWIMVRWGDGTTGQFRWLLST